MIETLFRPAVQKPLPETEEQWIEFLRSLPNYDPFTGADDFYFDEEAASKAVRFFEEKLHHVKGNKANQPFILEPWQKAVLCNLFGWKVLATGKRRYLECFFYVPRKNGKTPFAAGILLYMLMCDGEVGAELYGFAEDKDQAELVFQHAIGMVVRDQDMKHHLRVFKGLGQRSIVFEAMGSVYKIMPGDEAGTHGLNIHVAVVDELHAQKNPNLVDVIETGTGSREQPLLLYLTTADYDKPSVCNEKHEMAKQICEDPTRDLRLLPVLYEAEKDDAWDDPEVWKKANPNLHVSVSMAYLERQCKKAKQTPRLQNTFRRLHLNQKTEQATRWMDMGVWDENGGTIDDSVLYGLPCWVGVDLSATQDITAACKVWRCEGIYVARWRFWVPAGDIVEKSKRDKVPYEQWIADGWIEAHTEDVVDYGLVRDAMLKDDREYGVSSILIDPANATQFSVDMRDNYGLPIEFYRQGIMSMSPANKALERILLQRQLAHGNNPVARWMMGNVAVITDDNDNIKMTKKRSYGRIDGIVALVMALYAASLGEDDEAPKVTLI